MTGGAWPVEYAGRHIAGGVKPEQVTASVRVPVRACGDRVVCVQWDAFHELILMDELSRCGAGVF